MVDQKFEINLPPVSVITPAYNEQVWIKKTLNSILESGFPCEVIVVDDGSTDRTPKILQSFGSKIKVITHPQNKGKGAAIASGIKNANGEIIIFCDAHLLGLNKEHLLSLVLPLVNGSTKVVFGEGVPYKISLTRAFSPFLILTGQRAYWKKDLLPLVPKIENLGYGLEVFLFNKFRNSKTALVTLPGLTHLIKKDTFSPQTAAISYLKEGKEILKTLAGIQNLTPKEFTQLKKTISKLLSEYTASSRKKAKKYFQSLNKFVSE